MHEAHISMAPMSLCTEETNIARTKCSVPSSYFAGLSTLQCRDSLSTQDNTCST